MFYVPGRCSLRLRHNIRAVLGMALVLLLVGCGDETLYSDLSEAEANDMVALLLDNGVPGVKQGEADGRFTVMTEPDAFARAVNLLHANGFPRESFDSLGQVFVKEGFVSSPLEERARLNYALSQEIARTLSNIDGVVMARVHLAVPKHNEFSDTQVPASASVFVKHRENVDLTGKVSQIKALVVNGIENLPYDNVTVALFETADGQGVKPVVAPGADGDYSPEPAVQLGSVPRLPTNWLLVLLVVLCAVLLSVLLLRRRMSNSTDESAP